MADGSTAISNSQVADLVENLDKLAVLDSGGTTLVTFDVTWTSSTSGQLRVSGTPITATAASGGTAATVRLYDSGGSGEEINGIPVGTQGPPIEVSSTSISAGQDVDLRRFYLIGPFSDPVPQSFSISPSDASPTEGDTITWSMSTGQPLQGDLVIYQTDSNGNRVQEAVRSSSAGVQPTVDQDFEVEGDYYFEAAFEATSGGTQRSDEDLNSNPDQISVQKLIESAAIQSGGGMVDVTFRKAVTRGAGYSDNDWTLNVGNSTYSLTYSSGDGTTSK